MNPYIQLPKVPLVKGRQDLVLAKCLGKRVLHLGCVDAGMLQERFQSNELMHQSLNTVASELWGMDIDAEGIAYLQAQGFDHLIVADVCDPKQVIQALEGQRFDVIVASEVMEHLENPGLFLDSVRKLMSPGKTELVISVPNAFRIETLLWLLRGVEYVHPDHNYWFSYYTVTNLLRKKGFAILEVYAYSFDPPQFIPNKIRRLANSPRDQNSAPTRKYVSSSLPFASRVYSYFSTLPRRVIVALLYRQTVFWGDGIILVARIAEDVVK